MAVNISYNQEELRKIKDIELYILKSVHECCEELGIPYFMAYGTALGAVRHGGFIPWDDDIDIGMLRPDYNRFISNAKDILSKKSLFVQDISTEHNCPFPWAKVRMNNTVFVEYCNRNVKAHKGVYIDIFPFDELPKSIKDQEIQYNKVQKLTKLFVYHQTPDITEIPYGFKLLIKQLVRRSIHYLTMLIPLNVITKLLNDCMCQYNGKNTGVYGCLFYPKFKAGCMNKEMVTKVEPYKFENINTFVPGNVQEYLSSQYGDYMKLPPVEQRVGHRPFKVEL